MDEIKAKQQVVEKIKESAKILVTVSDSPSVDALSAALALTMLLDKKEKYATAIFSGETPPAIAFLEPEKTFDDTTDSLRDFIIALNKEKADHLRYKVEGDSVKIFITPYKTNIDQSDLEFSQGDYNVELVIALGVDNQENLDKALVDHGKILHDATIITVTAGEQSSNLGGIDWHDANASSLSEMIAGLAEALKDDKKKPILDEAISTALLTGIVAETDRFSNEHTTSKVMTVAATLMAAGADQQLIATELQASQEIATTPLEAPQAAPAVETATSSASEPQDDPSTLSIHHDNETLAELDRRVLGDEKAKEKITEEVDAIQEAAAEEEAKEDAEEAEVEGTLDVEQPEEVTEPEPLPEPEVVEAPKPPEIQETPEAVESLDVPQSIQSTPDPLLSYEPIPNTPLSPAYTAEDETGEPILGGTLNATTEQAAEDARREAERDQNKTILSHAYLSGTDTQPDPSGTNLVGFPGTPSVAPGSVGVNDVVTSEVHSAYAAEDTAIGGGGSMGGEHVIQPLSDAYAAPDIAPYVPPAPVPPEPGPTDLGLPLPPPIPDFSQVNGAPALPVPEMPQQPGILGDILAPEPAPGSAYAPETPFVPEQPSAAPPAPPVPPFQQPPVQSNDPGQFQIPSQQ